MRSRFAIASFPKTRVRAFGLALIALSSCALAPREEAQWRKVHLAEEIASASAFTQIVEERVGGAVTKSYVFGQQRISMLDEGGLHYYGYDAHSGVRALIDTSGAVTDTYEYDAFGNLLARAGTTANDFTYRGERNDAGSGLQDLRDRWRDPITGRFLTKDRFAGIAILPGSFNKYVYAVNSPIDLADPSGKCSFSEETIVVAVASTLNNIALQAGHAALRTVATRVVVAAVTSVATATAVSLATSRPAHSRVTVDDEEPESLETFSEATRPTAPIGRYCARLHRSRRWQ